MKTVAKKKVAKAGGGSNQTATNGKGSITKLADAKVAAGKWASIAKTKAAHKGGKDTSAATNKAVVGSSSAKGVSGGGTNLFDPKLVPSVVQGSGKKKLLAAVATVKDVSKEVKPTASG